MPSRAGQEVFIEGQAGTFKEKIPAFCSFWGIEWWQVQFSWHGQNDHCHGKGRSLPMVSFYIRCHFEKHSQSSCFRFYSSFKRELMNICVNKHLVVNSEQSTINCLLTGRKTLALDRWTDRELKKGTAGMRAAKIMLTK